MSCRISSISLMSFPDRQERCIDRASQSNCESWKKAGFCIKHESLIYHCKKTCNLCSSGKSCNFFFRRTQPYFIRCKFRHPISVRLGPMSTTVYVLHRYEIRLNCVLGLQTRISVIVVINVIVIFVSAFREKLHSYKAPVVGANSVLKSLCVHSTIDGDKSFIDAINSDIIIATILENAYVVYFPHKSCTAAILHPVQ